MDLCNQLCLSVWPTILFANSWHCAQAFQWDSFISAIAVWHCWSLSLYTTFSECDLAWRWQGQWKAKPTGFLFLYTSQLMRMKFERFETTLVVLVIKMPFVLFCDTFYQWKYSTACVYCICSEFLVCVSVMYVINSTSERRLVKTHPEFSRYRCRLFITDPSILK